MAGTTIGGLKASKTNRKRYGKDFYKTIAAKGGRVKVPKGFAVMDKEKQLKASRLGGSNGKRGKANA